MDGYELFQGNEKTIVKKNMKNMLQWSKIEYDKFKEKREIIHLQQAGEKLFNAIELYLSYISGYRFDTHGAPYQVIREKKLLELLNDANTLHQFFYNAENRASIEFIEEKYKNVWNRIYQRIERIR